MANKKPSLKSPNISGLFRVQYSQDLLDRLLPAIKNQTLSAADRLGVQEDLFALAKAGNGYVVIKLV